MRLLSCILALFHALGIFHRLDPFLLSKARSQYNNFLRKFPYRYLLFLLLCLILHVLLFYSDYTRKFRNTSTTYTFETWSQRFGFDANYNFKLGGYDLLVGAGSILPKIWGDPFNGEVNLPSLNTYSRLNIPLNEIFNSPEKRTMDRTRIKSFSLFLKVVTSPVTIFLDGLKLN